MKMERWLLAAVLITGCVGGAVTAKTVIPSVSADASQPSPAQRWQYAYAKNTSPDGFKKYADKLGEQGWELVGFDQGLNGYGSYGVFKRLLPPQ